MIGLLILEFSYVLGRLKILSNGLKIYDRNRRYELVCPMCVVKIEFTFLFFLVHFLDMFFYLKCTQIIKEQDILMIFLRF